MKTMEFDYCIDEGNIEPHDAIDHNECVLIHWIENNLISSSCQSTISTKSVYNAERSPISKLFNFCKIEEQCYLVCIEYVARECFVLIYELHADKYK